MLLLLFVALFALVALVINASVAHGVVPNELGWMSHRWLAQVRASHPS